MQVNEVHIIQVWNGSINVEMEVTVKLDTKEIAERMGQAAARSKGRKATAIGEAVTVTVELH